MAEQPGLSVEDTSLEAPLEGPQEALAVVQREPELVADADKAIVLC